MTHEEFSVVERKMFDFPPYKGFHLEASFIEENCYSGCASRENLDTVSFHGIDLASAEREFHISVDTFLEFENGESN